MVSRAPRRRILWGKLGAYVVIAIYLVAVWVGIVRMLTRVIEAYL
jgi:hypothetical protein